jgi:hypothetical protein
MTKAVPVLFLFNGPPHRVGSDVGMDVDGFQFGSPRSNNVNKMKNLKQRGHTGPGKLREYQLGCDV